MIQGPVRKLHRPNPLPRRAAQETKHVKQGFVQGRAGAQLSRTHTPGSGPNLVAPFLRTLELSHFGLATLVDVSGTESRVMAGMPQSSRKAAEFPPCRLRAEEVAPC